MKFSHIVHNNKKIMLNVKTIILTSYYYLPECQNRINRSGPGMVRKYPILIGLKSV